MLILGKYEIIEEIGRGGMGIVYKAKDTRLGRIVALKELVVSQAIIGQEREEIIARFQREAQTAAQLSHPNIVTIFDVGEENNRHFIAMEYLPGKSLKDYLDEEYKFSLDEIVDILSQIATGLEHAHSKGVVHRDVKPDNMKIIEDNVVKIMDFGIARIEGNTSSLTQDGTMLGTLGYISPEQLHNSKGVDSRADIFSYGAMMYEIFTKKLPFDGGTVGATILKIMTEDPIPPRKINPDIPEIIEKIIMKCLIKDPDKRYQKFKEIINEFNTFKFILSNPNMMTVSRPPEANINMFSMPPQRPIDTPPINTSIPGTAIPPQRPIDTSPINTSIPGTAIPPQRPIDTSPIDTSIPGTAIHLSKKTDDSLEPSEIKVSFIRQIAKAGTAKGQLNSPKGICSSNGILLIVDNQNRRVQAFDYLGEWKFLIQVSDMQSPNDVAMDKNGNIYVSDIDAKIRVFDNSGKFLRAFGGKGEGTGKLKSANGIAIYDDKIYIVDTDNYKIQVFNTNGNLITVFGKYGTKPGEFKSPYSVAVDEDRIYILDYGFPRVQVLDKNGISRLVFGQRGTGKGEFSIPKGIAVDKYGRIFVADTLNHRVQVFNKNGKWLYTFGAKGNGQGQFTGPEAISISDPYIFVLDKGNNRVQVFTYEI
ncbi:MAG: hypothetical protein KatS3mg068_0728 [Candidatus Sericytochromatia bacterium]|nr:MAG: hypothetical protein KatS3mg068_0728 [Candidatus Sericytochromatia bacterium]